MKVADFPFTPNGKQKTHELATKNRTTGSQQARKPGAFFCALQVPSTLSLQRQNTAHPNANPFLSLFLYSAPWLLTGRHVCARSMGPPAPLTKFNKTLFIQGSPKYKGCKAGAPPGQKSKANWAKARAQRSQTVESPAGSCLRDAREAKAPQLGAGGGKGTRTAPGQGQFEPRAGSAIFLLLTLLLR